MGRNRDNRTLGYTLYEVLLVIFLSTGLMLLAVRPINNLIEEYRFNRDLNTWFTMLTTARHLALQGTQNVVICSWSSNYNCVDEWQTTAMMFIDNNSNLQKDIGERQIVKYTWQSAIKLNRKRLSFSPFGYASTTAATLTICHPSSAKKIVISNIGRVRQEDITPC